jgi:integrase
MLTGCRLKEIADARWSEIKDGVLAIPAERTKNGLPLLLPLPARALEIIESMPRYTTGDYIFSSSAGLRPATAFSRTKAHLDAALAKAGDHVDPFVVHDFRRSFRTGLARLGISMEIAEACINHKKEGLVETYNRHQYFTEKGDALRAWGAHLMSIVEPTPEPSQGGEVVRLRRTPA